MHRSQILFYILLSFITGIFAGSFFSVSKTVVLIAAAICAGLIAVFYRRDSRLLNPRIALAAFLTLFLLAGILRHNTFSEKTRNLQKFARAQAEVVDPQNKHPIQVTIYGYLDEEPDRRDNSQQLVFKAKELVAGPYTIKTDERVLLTIKAYPEYGYGQALKVTGNVRLPENFSDFDYRAYLAKSNIFTVMSFPEITARTQNDQELKIRLTPWEKIKLPFFEKIFFVKKSFERSIARSVSEPNAAFVNGILLGSRSQIPQDLKDAFARTSMSHVLAISGYNITIIAWLISSFFLLFFRRQTAFWFSLLGVAVFTIMTGAQASVVRAAVMGLLVLLAQREGRLNYPKNAIALAGAVMILINPLILRHDIGFQLSFMATLGLVYLSPVIEKYFEKLPKFFQLRETMVMTLSAQIFVLPLLLYYFKSLSLTSLPANLIVLPTIPLAMLLGFAGGLGGIILPFLGQIIGYFVWLATSVQLGIIKVLASPSWASLNVEFPWYLVVVAYAALVWFLHKLSTRDHAKTE